MGRGRRAAVAPSSIVPGRGLPSQRVRSRGRRSPLRRLCGSVEECPAKTAGATASGSAFACARTGANAAMKLSDPGGYGGYRRALRLLPTCARARGRLIQGPAGIRRCAVPPVPPGRPARGHGPPTKNFAPMPHNQWLAETSCQPPLNLPFHHPIKPEGKDGLDCWSMPITGLIMAPCRVAQRPLCLQGAQ